jgi:hypothetical protein
MHDLAQDNLVKEMIAKRIIEVTTDGERDPNRLCHQALATLGIKR